MYAYVNTTGVKFLIMTEMDGAPKEEGLMNAFHAMQDAYVDAVSNPFYEFGERITSERFVASMERISKVEL